MTAAVKPQPTTYDSAASIARFSVSRYQEMIRQGILDVNDHVELLENYVVLKMPRNPKHDSTIQRINYTLIRTCPLPWTVRSQSAIALQDSQPEPDYTIVRGLPAEFENRHPDAVETGLVIEIANSSLLRDRNDKSRIYARAGIPIYWIVNLVDNRIEVYTQPSGPSDDPSYASCDMFTAGQSVPLVLDGNTIASIPVSELLG